MYLKVLRGVLILLLFVFSAFPGYAGENKWNTAGIRAGFSAQNSDKFFSKYEAFAVFGLPWNRRFENGWILGTFIGFNAGMIASDEKSFIGSVGPGLYYMTPGKSFAIIAGVYPTLIGESRFGTEDFGASFQFTSEIGVNLNFCNHWTVGYRFQHMSNAGISNENPGLNTHMAELGFRF